jgi:dihydroxyacetone kinase-like predicted kinase
VGDERTLHVHVHMADPGPALSAGAAAGSLRNIKIDNMQLQHEAWAAAQEAAASEGAGELPRLGLVAVAAGPGLAAAFRELGALPLRLEGGAKPSAGAFLEAARRAGTEHVFLLPNDKDAVLAAEQAAREAPDLVSVVPARSVAAGMSAAVAYLADGEQEEIEGAMRAAMRAVRCIEVTYSARNADIGGVAVHEGEPIALVDGVLVASGASFEAALLAGLQAAVVESSELLTVYVGADAPSDAEGLVRSILDGAYPALMVEVVDGGQPYYPYIVGVE